MTLSHENLDDIKKALIKLVSRELMIARLSGEKLSVLELSTLLNNYEPDELEDLEFEITQKGLLVLDANLDKEENQ